MHTRLFPCLMLAALCWACDGHAASTRTINFSKDGITPTAAQNGVIRHAAAADIKEFKDPTKDAWHVVTADLNDDGRADLLVQYTDRDMCGSSGCSGVLVMATATGFATEGVSLPNFVYRMDILGTKHHGMYDLHFDEANYLFKWDGKEYR